MNKRQKKKFQKNSVQKVITEVKENKVAEIELVNHNTKEKAAPLSAENTTPIEKLSKSKVKTVARKDTTAAKKKSPEFIIQYKEHEINKADVENAIKKSWRDKGNLIKDIKAMDIYVKPAEGKAYYTINDSVNDSVNIY